jgi:hypothetical protein
MKDSEQYETPENSRRRGASSDHLYFLPVPLRIDREPVISHDGVCRMEPARYSALRNEYIAAQFLFTDDFDMVLYRDETMAGIVYAASGGADEDLRAVIEYLSR